MISEAKSLKLVKIYLYICGRYDEDLKYPRGLGAKGSATKTNPTTNYKETFPAIFSIICGTLLFWKYKTMEAVPSELR